MSCRYEHILQPAIEAPLKRMQLDTRQNSLLLQQRKCPTALCWPIWEVVQGTGREIGPLAGPAQLGSPVWASWALRSARCQVPSSHEGHRQQPGYCAKTWYSYRRAVHTRMVLVKLPGLGTERRTP
jgi:hypothetical protein